ncbi:MAG TPA: 5-methyltetrahydrofolate--homocysteine methyltransferase [bacterium]|nr:5-methyltetrahydrofolate--homocysteine methyltransferase [bacterium]
MELKDLMGKKKVIILDGAMGTYISSLSFKEKTPEIANIIKPDLVKRIHKEYVEAGADIILTNTFGANRARLKVKGLVDKIEEINKNGAEIAKEVKREYPGILIAGDIGPSGDFLQPYGNLKKEDAEMIYTEQGEILKSSGVDFILLETFSDLEELKIAYRSIKENVNMCVVPCMTFTSKNYRTIMGQGIEDFIMWAEEEGEKIIGINCGMGSKEMKGIVRKLEGKDIILWVKPNAGMPELSEGKIIYPESPEEFVENCVEMVKMGIKFIGGCCGTNPEYIKLLKNRIYNEAC